MKQLIFSNLDGTLLNKNHKFSYFTKATIKKIMKQGVPFIINTGRITKSAIYLAKKLNCHKYNGYVISNNGCQIYSFLDHKLICDKFIDSLDLKRINSYLYEHKNIVDVHFYGRNSISAYEETYELKFWSKLMRSTFNVADEENTLEEINNRNNDVTSRVLLIFKTNDTEEINSVISTIRAMFKKLNIIEYTQKFYEIRPSKVDKGIALEFITKLLGANIKDTIAFGDSYNDLSFIKASGMPIAVKNAIPLLKLEASEIIESNSKNGPALYLWKKFLNK